MSQASTATTPHVRRPRDSRRAARSVGGLRLPRRRHRRCSSSARSRASSRSSVATPSTSGSTTAATSSASPATDMTARSFLVRGLLAGLVAGLLAFAVAYVVGEPHIDAAIAVEEANAAHEAEHAENPPADGHTHGHEDDEGTVVSRANQSTWGLATGTLAVGIALGGVTGLAAAFAVGRIGRLRPSQSTALVVADRLRGDHPRAAPQVPGDAAGGRQPRHDRRPHPRVLRDDGPLRPRGGRCRRCSRAASSTRCGTYRDRSSSPWRVPRRHHRGRRPVADRQRGRPTSRRDTLWYFRLASMLTLTAMWAGIGVVLTGLIGRLYERESSAAARRDLAASL